MALFVIKLLAIADHIFVVVVVVIVVVATILVVLGVVVDIVAAIVVDTVAVIRANYIVVVSIIRIFPIQLFLLLLMLLLLLLLLLTHRGLATGEGGGNLESDIPAGIAILFAIVVVCCHFVQGR